VEESNCRIPKWIRCSMYCRGREKISFNFFSGGTKISSVPHRLASSRDKRYVAAQVKAEQTEVEDNDDTYLCSSC
jgi:hypothetical protein